MGTLNKVLIFQKVVKKIIVWADNTGIYIELFAYFCLFVSRNS